MNIVAIDDDYGSLESIVFTLNKVLGHQVEFFGNAEEAIAFIFKNRQIVDLIMIDEDMPGLSGRELGKQISGISGLEFLPLVMLTAYKEIDFAVDALSECGFDYFVWKNDFVSKEEITKTINHVFNLPSVRKKGLLRDMEEQNNYLTHQLNTNLVKNYVENIELMIKNTRDKKTYDTILNLLMTQEKALKIMIELRIRPTMCSLPAAIILLDQNPELFIGSENEIKQMLESLRFVENYPKFGLKKTIYNRIKKQFQPFDENKILTKSSLIILSTIISNKEAFSYTLKEASRGKNSYTFISPIISIKESYYTEVV
ncbi:MAG: response regulator [Pseudomonadota bacterium]